MAHPRRKDSTGDPVEVGGTFGDGEVRPTPRPSPTTAASA
jgi:hypothetical protein